MHFTLNIREITYKTRVAHSVFSKVALFFESIFLCLNGPDNTFGGLNLVFMTKNRLGNKIKPL